MENSSVTITLDCLFCGSPLKGDENVKISSGDLIKCATCGEQNDYDSVLEVAKEKGTEELKAAAVKQIDKMLKDIFK